MVTFIVEDDFLESIYLLIDRSKLAERSGNVVVLWFILLKRVVLKRTHGRTSKPKTNYSIVHLSPVSCSNV